MVSETQFGFVPGRQVHDAVDIWTAAQQLARTGQIPSTAVAVFLDFAKAYDTLDRGFLDKVLRRHGLPECFTRVIQAMHLATTAEYSAQGSLSTPQAVHNGIRQGCPLAPLLFLLAIDTLYEAVSLRDIRGVRVGTHDITAVGFADDTTVYLKHWSDESNLITLLQDFGAASGLQVNLAKCAVVRLFAEPSQPDSDKIHLQLPLMAPRQQIRYLGVQIASYPTMQRVWETAVQQLQARLHLSTTKTTDLFQRVELARAIGIPKLMFVARHCWPTAEVVRNLQTFLQNYIWRNRLTTTPGQGRAWTGRDVAMLPTGAGGLNVPNVTEELLLLAAAAYRRWSEHRTLLLMAVATVLRDSNEGPVTTTRAPPATPRLGRTLRATGRALLQHLAVITWDDDERHQAAANCADLLGRRPNLHDGHWRRGWWHRNYAACRDQLYALQRLQRRLHGTFAPAGLLLMSIRDSRLFVDEAGHTVSRTAYQPITAGATTLGDVLEFQKTGECELRFRCKTVAYPMTNREAACFKRLCDTLVACYPDVLRNVNEHNQLQPRPPQEDEWWIQKTSRGHLLLWSPTPGSQLDLGQFSLLEEAEALARAASGSPRLRFVPHPDVSPVVPLWTSSRNLTRDRLKKIVRGPRIQRGLRALRQKEDLLHAQSPLLADGLRRLSWQELKRIPHLASRHKLLLYRLKTGCISGWDHSSQHRGCPHCPDAGSAGGTIAHIFWDYPRARDVWNTQFSLWEQLGLRLDHRDTRTRLSAAFSLTLPHMPARLWNLTSTASVQDPAWIVAVHAALREAWRQHCVATIATIWRWRCGEPDQEHPWTRQQAAAYAGAAARSAWSLLSDALIFTDAPSAAIDTVAEVCRLSADANLSLDAVPDTQPAPAVATQLKLLFFDGGSRGNPGPGGAGSVLVETDSTGAHTSIAWCAAFSYPHPSTTNNYAEYQGVVEGLAEAKRQGWRHLHVVGDSRLILDQLKHYHPPRNRRLLSLYAQARRLADELGVHQWSHHLRAHNKMADAAANIAMDHGQHQHRGHPSQSSLFAPLLLHLRGDIARWSEGWFTATIH